MNNYEVTHRGVSSTYTTTVDADKIKLTRGMLIFYRKKKVIRAYGKGDWIEVFVKPDQEKH